MLNKHRQYRTGFGELGVLIDCNNDDALSIAQFLFADFPGVADDVQVRHYDIISSGPKPMLSLWDGEKNLYYGQSRYQLAYILMNEVIFHCIDRDKTNIALHAGAVYKGDRCLLLPGKSGKGKSTLTGWLVQNGFHYLTDELVFLRHDGAILPLVRPINLKVMPAQASWLIPETQRNGVLASDSGAMIPHRMVNPEFVPALPRLTDIIFPEFSEGSPLTFDEISPAKSCLYLLQSHVNARNLDGHGVARLAKIIRKCRSYKLKYSRFSDLETVLRLFQ